MQDNDIEMYSTHNERRFIVAERFIRTLKNKIYIYMGWTSKMCKLLNYQINDQVIKWSQYYTS